MELRAYGSVIWRWKWLIAVVALLTFAASFVIQVRESATYEAVVRLALKPNLPLTSTEYSPAEHQYYEYVASEYLNDDVMEVTEGASFQAAVAERAAAALNRPVSVSFESDKAHKLLFFTVSANDPAEAVAVGAAIAELLTDPNSSFYAMFVSYNPSVTLVDEIKAEPAAGASRALLFVVLRVVLALVAGLGLAFLLEYLDDTLRSAREVEALTGLAVLAEIPAGRGTRRASAAAGPEGTARTA